MSKKNLVIFLAVIIFITILFLIIYKKEKKAVYLTQNQPVQNIQENNIEVFADKIVNWSVYLSSIYKITFKYPAFWNRSINDLGVSGDKGEMIFISPFLGGGRIMDDVVYDEINQRMQPYDIDPVIEKLQIKDHEGRLIISKKSNLLVGLIIKYPKPIRISEADKREYNYLLVSFSGIDLDLIREIIKTIDFYNLKI